MVDGVGVIGLDGLNGVIMCMRWMKERAGRVGVGGDQDWVCGWMRDLRGGGLGGWWVGMLEGGGQVFLLGT